MSYATPMGTYCLLILSPQCIKVIIYMHLVAHRLYIYPKLKGCTSGDFPKLLFGKARMIADNKRKALYVVTSRESKIGGGEIIDGKHSNFNRAS